MLFYNVLSLCLPRMQSLDNLEDTKLLLHQRQSISRYKEKFLGWRCIISTPTCLVKNKHTRFLIFWCMLLLGLTLEMFAAKKWIWSFPTHYTSSQYMYEKEVWRSWHRGYVVTLLESTAGFLFLDQQWCVANTPTLQLIGIWMKAQQQSYRHSWGE